MEHNQGWVTAGNSPRPNHWRSKAALCATKTSAASKRFWNQRSACFQGCGRRVTTAGMRLIGSAALVSAGNKNDCCAKTALDCTSNKMAPTSTQQWFSGSKPVVSVSRINSVLGTTLSGDGAWDSLASGWLSSSGELGVVARGFDSGALARTVGCNPPSRSS